MFNLVAVSKITRERCLVGTYELREDARRAKENSDWDAEEWAFTLEEIEDEESEDWSDWDDCDYEIGYDPYCGCYTDDC